MLLIFNTTPQVHCLSGTKNGRSQASRIFVLFVTFQMSLSAPSPLLDTEEYQNAVPVPACFASVCSTFLRQASAVCQGLITCTAQKFSRRKSSPAVLQATSITRCSLSQVSSTEITFLVAVKAFSTRFPWFSPWLSWLAVLVRHLYRCFLQLPQRDFSRPTIDLVSVLRPSGNILGDWLSKITSLHSVTMSCSSLDSVRIDGLVTSNYQWEMAQVNQHCTGIRMF